MTRISMILLSGAIGLCLSGCAATSPTMRAQSPNVSFASYSGCGSCGNSGCPSCNNGYAREGMSVDCYGGMCQSGNCEYGNCQSGSCQGGCPSDQCLNVPFHPVHRNFHSYHVPQDLKYPQDNTPAAVYQYPYYTTRGPTDFFMK